MTDLFEFRVAGQLSDDLLSSFGPIESHQELTDTVFTCRVRDDAEFFGVIARCEGLRLRLLELRRISAVA